MNNTQQSPYVGVGVLIVKEGKILMAKRKAVDGDGHYSFPGGHLECFETFEECAIRETLEETGIEIQNVRQLCVFSIIKDVPKHYVTIGMVADWASGEPQNLEPHKSEDWAWYDLDALPEGTIYVHSAELLRRYREGV